MGLFFKKKVNSKTNKYLEDQQALFNTKGEPKPELKEEKYDGFVFKEKDYSDIPKYKAFDEKKVDVVIDRDALGFQGLNPDIQTVDIQKEDLHEDLHEIVNNAPVDEETKENNKSIYDCSLKHEIEVNEPIEIIDIDDKTDIVVDSVVEAKIEEDKKLSIFGNSDEPIQAKVYDVKEVPHQEKIDVIDVEVSDNKDEPKENIKFNEKGNKICPQCGAPLEPSAPVCFLCGNKF